MFSGFIREIDSVGRIVIPKQIRKELGINEQETVFLVRVFITDLSKYIKPTEYTYFLK